VRGVWRELLGDEPVEVPPYAPDWDEVQRDEALWAAAAAYLRPRAVARPGDVLLFRMRDGAVAKHLGILSEGGAAPRFIHAYSGHGVVENSLSAPWRRRVVAAFAFPGGAD
jgi:NlpC/P60 family putative phage cell wall peptidase